MLATPRAICKANTATCPDNERCVPIVKNITATKAMNGSTSRTCSRHGSPPGKCWAKPNTFSVRGTSQTWSRHSGSILRHAFFLYKLLVTIEYTSSNLAAVKIVRSSTFSTFWIVCRPRQRRPPFQAELREYDEDNRG